MSSKKIDQAFQHAKVEEIEKEIRESVAQALRQEYDGESARIKRISKTTGIKYHSVRNWYKGENTLSAAHLVLLARLSPQVLHTLLTLIGRPGLWVYCDQENTQPEVIETPLSNILGVPIYTAKNCGVNVFTTLPEVEKFNVRQTWFLKMLGEGKKICAGDIVAEHGVTRRTAENDIAALKKAGVIHFTGSCKTGGYMVVKSYREED